MTETHPTIVLVRFGIEVKKFTITTGRHEKSAYSFSIRRHVVCQPHDEICGRADRTARREPDLDVTSLSSACLIALFSVFVLLGSLALIMELITAVFPDRESSIDPVLVAAISTAVASVYPGARVTRIEEE